MLFLPGAASCFLSPSSSAVAPVFNLFLFFEVFFEAVFKIFWVILQEEFL